MPVSVEIPDIGEVEFPDSMAAEDIASASKRLYSERRPQPQFQAPQSAPFSPGRENPELGLYTPRVDPRFEPTSLQHARAPKGPLFARPGVLARSPADLGEVIETLAGQLLHPIKSTEAAIEQFTGAPKFSGPYAPPVQHVSEILDIGPKIPKFGPQEGTVKQIGAGAANAVTSFLDIFLTPGGASTVGIGALPQAAKKAVLTEFAVKMATDAPEQLEQGVRLLQEGKVQEGTQHLLGGAGSAFLANVVASHVPTKGPPIRDFTPLSPTERAQEQARVSGLPSQEPLPKAPETPQGVSEPAPPPEAAPTGAGTSAAAIPEQPVKAAEAPQQAVPAPQLQKPSAPFSPQEAKAQKAYLLEEIDKAHADAPVGEVEYPNRREGVTEADRGAIRAENEAVLRRNMEKFGTITIRVPGDGVFTVINERGAISRFKEMAKEFPTTSPKPAQPRVASTKPTAAAPLATAVKNPEVVKAAELFTGQDVTRQPLYQVMWSDGTRTVSTDGRRMLIVEQGIGGTKKTPKVFDLRGKETQQPEGVAFPRDWEKVIPTQKPKHQVTVDTEQLHNIVRQAELMTTERAPSVRIAVNPDNTIGVSSLNAELEGFAHNVHENPQQVVFLDPSYVRDALNAARRLGDEKVKLAIIDELSPVQFIGSNHRSIIMPMRGAGGTPIETVSPKAPTVPETRPTVPERGATVSPEPAISFPGIGSLREKQATAMELGKIRKSEPELWKAITQMFGTDQPAKIAKLAKRRMEESKTPPPDVEQRAMLSGSHIAGIPDPISLAFAVTFGTKTGREMVGEAARFYSEPLAERIATEGGPQAKAFGGMAREIAQRAKELYGSLTDVLDPALQEMGKLNRTTTWLNDLAPTKKRWGFRNAQAAVEGPLENVPPQYRAVVELLKAANLRIGQLAERVVEGFKATGRYQRPPTDFLIDTIRAGQGQAFDVVKNSLAAENKIHPAKVKKILLGIKEELDAPGSEQTVHRIAQEFERHFKKFPTDIRVTTPLGEVWMPILHARPFEYLQNAATRTAQRVAFLERVPQGTLPELRKTIVSELKSPEAFDDLVRALHGLPVNQPLRLFAPGSLQSMIAQGANRVLTDVFGSLKLTASAIYNIPETVFGNTPAFFGWRNFARGAISLKERWKQLENIGAINRAIYNFSFDPKAPVRSVLSQFRQGVRKATMQQFFNEMQEMLAASTAQVFAERAQGKELSVREQGLFTETAVAMGYTRAAARAMAEGRGTTEQYGSFTRRAAAFATGGNIQPAEMSRFGGNRVLTGLFRFQSYPIMKLNAFRKTYTNFTEAVESKDPRRIKASSEILAKFLFGTTAQGTAAAFLAALLTGRGGGVQQTLEEAEENPAKFILDSVMGGMGGPVSAINYAIGTGKTRDLVDPRKINAGVTFPGSIYLELKQLFNTEGPYAGMPLPQAVQKYLETRVPVGKMIRHAFEEAGFASKSASTSNAIYRIHQDWLKRHPDEAVREDYQRNLELTTPESKYSAVYAAIRARDLKGLQAAIENLESKGTDIKAIKQAIKTNLQPGKRLFHGKQELEQDFVESLTPAQRKLYESALDERQEQYDFLDGNF